MLRENREPPTGAVIQPISAEGDQSCGNLNPAGVRGAVSATTIRNAFKDYVNRNPIMYV